MQIIRPKISSARRGGFSLIEIVMALLIVACVGGMALPRYARALSHYRLDAAVNRVVADVALARSQAMTKGTSQTITYSTDANGYTMTGVTSLENNSANYAVKLGAEPYKVTLAAASFGATAKQTVTFDCYGGADNSGSVTLSCGGVSKIVNVESTMGKTVVQ